MNKSYVVPVSVSAINLVLASAFFYAYSAALILSAVQGGGWPLGVILASSIIVLASVSLAFSSIVMWRGSRFYGAVAVASILVLASLEIAERLAMHFSYGSDVNHDLDSYVYGPLLVLWALINWLFLTRKTKK